MGRITHYAVLFVFPAITCQGVPTRILPFTLSGCHDNGSSGTLTAEVTVIGQSQQSQWRQQAGQAQHRKNRLRNAVQLTYSLSKHVVSTP